MGEHYNAKPMAANAAQQANGIGGFLCTAAGTLTVTDADGTVLLNALPVAAGGLFIRIPLSFRTNAGGVVQLGGGAAGTLFA